MAKEPGSKEEFTQWLGWALIVVAAVGVGFLCLYMDNSLDGIYETPTASIRVKHNNDFFMRTGPNSVPSVSASPSIASLNTYTNKTYGFSFKYPSNWKVTESIGSSDQPLQVQLASPNDNAEMGPSLTLTLDAKDSPADVIKLNTERYSKMANFQKSELNFAGLDATHIAYTDHFSKEPTNTFPVDTYVLKKDKFTYIISSQGYADNGLVSNLDQIWASFNFAK